MRDYLNIIAYSIEAPDFHAALYSRLLIITATVAVILLLLLIVKCITKDSTKTNKKEHKHVAPVPSAADQQEVLYCPMCGWQHPAEQKVCRNPKCKIRF